MFSSTTNLTSLNTANWVLQRAYMTKGMFEKSGITTVDLNMPSTALQDTQAMFRNIEKLKVGDKITITNYWEELTYEVKSFAVIYPDQVNNIFIQEGKEMLTLSTCHPYRYNYQRYIVYCERIK